MKIHRSFRFPSRPYPNLAVGPGNFDGVHLGHLRVISELRKLAGSTGTVGVITFTNHTRSLVAGRREKLLLTVADRLRLLREAGVDVAWLVDFDRRLADMTAGAFAADLLAASLGVKAVVVGEGYRFGRDGRGTVSLLAGFGRRLGFTVREVRQVRLRGVRVSSSAIRRAVGEGDMPAAAEMLGRPYFLSGAVRPGEGRGASLGYPTANFRPEQLAPPPGVYAAWMEFGGRKMPGLLYLGRAPTFPGPRRLLVAEAHVFDWKGSLYGGAIRVWLKKKLRGEVKFDSIDDLRGRIRDDEREARRFLSRVHSRKANTSSRRKK